MANQYATSNQNEDKFKDSDSHKNGVSPKFIQQILDDYEESREDKGKST